MRKTVKLQIEMSEKREAINKLLGKEELSDEERGELDTLTKRAQEIEVELRAALVVDGESEERARAAFDGTPATTPEATPEARELERITAAASVADIVHAAVEKRATDGATAELQKHLSISGDQVPLELLETRAATHTPAPTDGEPNAQQFVPAVFPGSIAAFLGIAQPTVAVGISSYHVLTTNLTANVPAAGADGANTAGAFTSASLEPKRVQGAFVLRREDKARLGPQLESALRENLGMVLSTKLDQELITGAGGFMAAADPAIAAPDAPGAAVAGYADFVKGVSDQVDGLYADTVAGVRILLGPGAYKRGLSVFRAGTAAAPAGGDLSALERMQALSGGVRASSHIPAVAASVEQALAARATGLTHFVQPIWQGPTLIVDEVTRADMGEIVLTLVGLFAQKLVRAAGFARMSFRVAARSL